MANIFHILIFVVCSSTLSHAEWTEEKMARELVFAVALINDWQQTLIIADKPGKREKNRILGPKPHRDNVNIYFAGCLIGHAAVAYMLPDNYAKIWQDVWIGIETNSSNNNVKKGHVEEVSVGYRLTHTIKF